MPHRLSAEAEAELDDIWWYLARESGNVEIARDVVASITERFYLLAEYPQLGRKRDELRLGLRSHVFHGRRDIEGLLRDP